MAQAPRLKADFGSVLSLVGGPFDHGLRRAIQEDEFGVQLLLQLQFSGFPHQENVHAEFEDPVDARQLLEHDGVRDLAEKASDELADDQHHRHVQAHDPKRREASV